MTLNKKIKWCLNFKKTSKCLLGIQQSKHSLDHMYLHKLYMLCVHCTLYCESIKNINKFVYLAVTTNMCYDFKYFYKQFPVGLFSIHLFVVQFVIFTNTTQVSNSILWVVQNSKLTSKKC